MLRLRCCDARHDLVSAESAVIARNAGNVKNGEEAIGEWQAWLKPGAWGCGASERTTQCAEVFALLWELSNGWIR
jgi:hypothetical protein